MLFRAVYWLSPLHNFTAQTQVLNRFKSSLRNVRDSLWWKSLTMVPAGTKAKRLSSINYSTKWVENFAIYFFFKKITFNSNYFHFSWHTTSLKPTSYCVEQKLNGIKWILVCLCSPLFAQLSPAQFFPGSIMVQLQQLEGYQCEDYKFWY